MGTNWDSAVAAKQAIADAMAKIPWQDGDRVRVKPDSRESDWCKSTGVVAYRYYNGFTLVRFGDEVDSTECVFANTELEKV
jgi:hypothetical protein